MKKGMKLAGFGTIIMDMFPGTPCRGIAGQESFIPSPGGACANVAVGAARLGVEAAFMGKAGDDAFGRYLKSVLENNGVDTRALVFDRKHRTTLNFHAGLETGEIEYLFYRNPGADELLEFPELDLELLKEVQIFHFDSLCLTAPVLRGTTMRVLELFAGSDTLVSFDVNYRDAMWTPGECAREVYKVWPYLDIIKMNETEHELLFDTGKASRGIVPVLSKNSLLGLLTLGKKGSLLIRNGGILRQPAMDIEPVDPIGCGDAFIAAFLSYLMEHGLGGRSAFRNLKTTDLAGALTYADTAASLAATKRGAMPALPGKAEVEFFFNKRTGQKEYTGDIFS
ncbi:MAG: carbohydrate kinase [Treponema sp.]|jgi:fructokinase|nr:carbohydrate kinase [Treponema sp.]